jgi:hypothetical protein
MRPRAHLYKIDSLRAKFSGNFYDFVDFPLKLRVFKEVKGPNFGGKKNYFAKKVIQ